MSSPSSPSHPARRVLVVEDDLDSALAFANMVEAMIQHKVEVALNGYVALDLAKKIRPEVVFLDLRMRGMDGFEVARRLKNELGDAVRIVAVTAYGTDDDREQSAKAGCELHLLKPVEPRTIEALVA